jgi:phosphate transport system substrate-binding protein
MNRIHILGFMIAAVVAASPGGTLAQALEVSGATTVQKRILEPGAGPLKSATGVELKILAPGTGKGMLALIDGKVSVAAAGEALEDAVESAKKAAAEAGRAITVPGNLVYHAVASDNIVFAVHPDNKVAALTPAQVKSIFTGQATNWKTFNGPDLPIRPLAPAPGQAVRTVVEKSLLAGSPFGSGTVDIGSALDQLKATAASPGAIAPYSQAVIKDSSEKLRIIPGTVIPRPLGFVTIGSPSPEAKKMIDFFRSPEGRKTIR